MDGSINILDIVDIAQMVLFEDESYDVAGCADVNQDGQVNVVDVVMIIESILSS